MAKAPDWTEREIGVLRDRYKRHGARGCAKRLPGRSMGAIKTRANRLGLIHRAAPPWSSSELDTLRREWHEVGERTLRGKLRGRTWIAIRAVARELGLPFGVPQGCESVRASAARNGYDDETFRRVLQDAGVRVRACYRGDYRGDVRAFYVEIDEADRAVAMRASTETITGAARRLGITPRWLWCMLMRVGLRDPVREARGSVRGSAYRLLTTAIEAGIIEYRLRYAKRRDVVFTRRPVRPGYRPLAQWRTGAEVSRAA